MYYLFQHSFPLLCLPFFVQEAFRGIEDIHSLISGPRQKAKASLLENFYQKQASVYWMANNKLFHAAALYRLFVLRKEQKKTFSLESEEAKKFVIKQLLHVHVHVLHASMAHSYSRSSYCLKQACPIPIPGHNT